MNEQKLPGFVEACLEFEEFRFKLHLKTLNWMPSQWVLHRRFPSEYTVRINRTLEHL